MFRTLFAIALGVVIAIPGPATAQETDRHDKRLDIQSSAGGLHMGNDADARKAGLPLYPGARLSHDEDNGNALNLGVLTQAFGLKLVVAKYDSGDAPEKVIDFYREHLKKYGKVLECHTRKPIDHAGRDHADRDSADSDHADTDHADSDDDKNSKELKCEGGNTGPVTELKVGTPNNQHVVAVQPNEARSGSTFALVYVRTHGKQGDI